MIPRDMPAGFTGLLLLLPVPLAVLLLPDGVPILLRLAIGLVVALIAVATTRAGLDGRSPR